MSWWTDLRDGLEFGASAGAGFLAGGPVGAVAAGSAELGAKNYYKHQNDQRDAVNGQIKAYQDQTALTKQQLDDSKNSMDAEKRRVNEKQIRALRRNYRAQGSGLLGVGQPANPDMDNKLGG